MMSPGLGSVLETELRTYMDFSVKIHSKVKQEWHESYSCPLKKSTRYKEEEEMAAVNS